MSPSIPGTGADCYPASAVELDWLSALRPFDLIEYDHGYGMCDQHRKKRNRKLREDVLPMYKAGLPLFTKPMLEEVDRQINGFQHKDCDQTIYVTGIDGKKYGFNVGHGPVSVFPLTPGVEGVRENLTVMYRPLQDLCNADQVSSAYSNCSITIQQHIVPRFKASGEYCLGVEKASSEEISERFWTAAGKWEESQQCRTLRSLLEASTIRHQVTKLIAFACGTMLSPEVRQNSRASYQHALILTLRDIFSKKQDPSTKIECFAQDPSYTDIDKSILQGAGVGILNDPNGFVEVDDNTLLITFAPNVPVKQIIADLARPVLIIWDSVVRYENEEEMLEGMFTDPTSPRVIEMVDKLYHKLEFPSDHEHFGHAEIYIKI